MRPRDVLLALLAVAFPLACAGGPPPRHGEGVAAGARAADVALDAAVAVHDRGAFLRLVCADAMFGGRARLSEGREAVAEAWARLLEAGGPSLRWAPERSHAARSGDLAVTTGRWSFRSEGGEARGEYVTVWRREGAGWCALLDLGMEPADALGALLREPVRSARSSAGDLETEMGRFRTAPQGRDAAVEGAYLTVRRRVGEAWETVLDSAVAFAPPP